MNKPFLELPTNTPGTVKSANNNFTTLDAFSARPSDEDLLSTPYQVTPLNKIEGVGRYLNSSTYQKLGYSSSPELEDQYYRETPWYNQVGNATAQFFGQAGASFEAQMSKLEQVRETFGTTNEDYLKDTFQASEDLRERFPVFKSSRETYGILGYTPFGEDAFSKWSNFAPNLGFTFGTMAGVFLENAVATAIIEATTGGAGTPLVAGKWLKGLYEGIKDIKTFSDIKKLASVANIGKGLYNTEKILGSAGNVVRGYEAFKAGKSLNGALHSVYGGYQLYSAAAGEALIENANSVGEVMKDFKTDFIQRNGREPNGAELAKMQESAEGIILPSSLGNIGILMASNALQEMNAFKAGKSLSALAISGSNALAKQVGKKVVFDKGTGLYRELLASEITKANVNSGIRGVLNVLSEGVEESAQGVVAEATKNYFKAKYYDRPIGWTDAVGQGFAYASSDQGMEEFYAGIVTGGIFSGGGKALNQYQLRRDENANFKKTGKTINDLAKQEIQTLNDDVVSLIKFNLAASPSSENVKVQTVIQKQIMDAYAAGDLKTVKKLKRAAAFKAMFTAKAYGKDEELLKHYENLNALEKSDLAKYLNIDESDLESTEQVNESIQYLKDSGEMIDVIAKTMPNPAKKTHISDPKYANMTPEEMKKAYLEDNAMFEAWQGAQELLASQYFFLKDLQKEHGDLKLNLEGTNMPMDLLAAIMASDDEQSSLEKDLINAKRERNEITDAIKAFRAAKNKKEVKNLNESLKETLAEIKELEEKVSAFENPNENAQVNYLKELDKKISNVKLSLDLIERNENPNQSDVDKYTMEFLTLIRERAIIESTDKTKEEKIKLINELRPEDKKLKFNPSNLLSSPDSIKSVEDLIKIYNELGKIKDDIDYSENIINTLNSKEKMSNKAGLMFGRIYEARQRLFSNIENGITSEDIKDDEEKTDDTLDEKEKEKKKIVFKVGDTVTYNDSQYTIDSIKFKEGESIYVIKDSEGNLIEVKDAQEFNKNKAEEKVVIKDVTDEEYKNFIDNGIVTNERILAIANKIKNNEKLSPRETEIFTDKTSEINKELADLKKKEEQSKSKTVEELRKEEQDELAAAIPNIESYKVNGKIDKSLMTPEDLKKYKKIYDKYDELITPLLIADIEERRHNEIMSELAKALDEDAFLSNRELTPEEKTLEQKIIKEINDKYDAELAKLKPKKTEDSKSKESENKSNISLLSTPSDDIVKELSKLNTLEEKLNWLKTNNLLAPIDINGKSYDIIDYSDRVMVLMKIGKYNIPFYISTGQAGKKNVEAGKWYAVFGIGESKGWINKGTEEEINNSYGFPIFQKISKILNEGIGRVESREDNGNGRIKDGIGFLSNSKEDLNSFNKNMNLPTEPAGDNTKVQEFYDHVNNTIKLLNDELKAMASAERMAEEMEEKTAKEKAAEEKEKITKEEFLNENQGRSVILNGIKGILTKVNDNIYELETEGRVYEFPIDTIDTFEVPTEIVSENEAGETTEKPVEPQEIKKYNVTSVTETEAVVNKVKYLINTDEKGNIVSLSPVNTPTQKIKNEKLLIAVEIERNKQDLNDSQANANTVEELISNYPNLDVLLNSIWEMNLNDTIVDALEKLYNKQPLTNQEALQTAIWLSDVFDRITKLIKSNNSKQENDTILQAYNTAEIINSLLYDLNNLTTNHNENRKTATDVEQVKNNVSSKRGKRRLAKQIESQVESTEAKEEEVKPQEVLEKGPNEKLITDLKTLKEFVNNSEDLEKDMDRIFETLNEQEYSEWQDSLDPITLQEDLKELIANAESPKEVGNILSKYLLNRFIDTQIEQMGETSLSPKKEEDAIKAEAGNSGNINTTDAMDSVDPIDGTDFDSPLKTKEEFLGDLVEKISGIILRGEKIILSKEEKEFYDDNTSEVDKLVNERINKKETGEEEEGDEVLENKKEFLEEFNKLLLITGQNIASKDNMIYRILKRIKFSISEQWFKFKDKEVSVNLKKVLEKLAKKYKNLTFENVAKEYTNVDTGETGVQLYVNRIINNSVKEAYDNFELFKHQHSLHLDINEENTELIMDKLMKFANENDVYILIGSAYNISRPDNIRIYTKDEKLSTEVLDNLLSSIASITSYEISNPVINDIQYEKLPTREALVKFINSVDADIRNEVLNYLGLNKKNRDFLTDSSKNYKNGLSLNSLAAAKLFAKAYEKFKLSGKIQRQYIIAPIVEHQIKKAVFYGEIKVLHDELISNPMFKDIVNRKYFKSLIDSAADKMEKLKVFNFGNTTLSIGDTLYDQKNKEYTIIDNTILGKEVGDIKDRSVKFMKVLKIQDNLTKEEKLITQYEFKNQYSIQPFREISSPQDLKEKNKKEKESNENNLLPSSLFTTISNDTDIFFITAEGRREKRESVDQNAAIGRLVLQRIAEAKSSSTQRTKVKVEIPGYDVEDSVFYIEPGKRNSNVPERIEEFILEKLNGKKFSELNPEELEEIKSFFGKIVTIVDKEGSYIKYDSNGLENKNGIIPLYFLPKGDLSIAGDTISYGGRVLMPISTMVEKFKMTEEEVKQRATKEAEQLNNLHSSTEPIYLSLAAVSNGMVDDEDTLKYSDVKHLDDGKKLNFEMSRDKKQKGEIFMNLNGTTIKLKQKAMGEDMALAILAYLGVEDGYLLSRGFKVGKEIKQRYNKLKAKMKEMEEAEDKLGQYKVRIEYLNFLNRTLFMSMKNFEVLFDTYFMMDSKPEIFEAISLRDYNTDKSEKDGIPNLFPISDTWKRLNNNKNNDDYYSYLDTVVSLLSKVVFDTNPDFVQSINNDNFVSMDNVLDIKEVYVKEYLMDKYSVRGILVNDSLLNAKNRYVMLDTPAKKETPLPSKNFEDLELNDLIKLMEQEEMDNELPSLNSISRSNKASIGRKDLPATEEYKQNRIGEIRNALTNIKANLSKEDSEIMKKGMKEATTMAEVDKVQMDTLEKYNCKINE